MKPSEGMKEHSYQLDQKANDDLLQATELLTGLTKRGQEIDEPYLSELLEILGDDNLVGDLDRFKALFDEFQSKKRKFFHHAVQRISKMGKTDLTDRILDQWVRWTEWEEALLKVEDLIESAEGHRHAAMAARELARVLADAGQ